jgi:hypothetical protein
MIDDTVTTRDNAVVAVNVQLTARELNDMWSGSRVRYLVWLVLPVGLLYAYFAFATVVNDGFTSANALTVLLYGMVALIALFPGFIVSRARARLMLRYGPTVRELRRYAMSIHGVHFDSDLMTCRCQWGAFSRVLENPRCFLLYQTPMSAMIIPKRCFSSPEEIDQLRVLLREHFKGKLKLRAQ